MSELFYLQRSTAYQKDRIMLPRDAIMQNEEKEKIGYLIGQDWAYYRQPLPRRMLTLQFTEAIKAIRP
jgi:hypothetical protein